MKEVCQQKSEVLMASEQEKLQELLDAHALRLTLSNAALTSVMQCPSNYHSAKAEGAENGDSWHHQALQQPHGQPQCS
ncbi:hypothetical protein SRHO_G00010770 [Serrasalmus rhombeus]